MTNAFFAESISRDWWARADIERGSFRTYLRVMLQRFGTRYDSAPSDHVDTEVEAMADSRDDPGATYDREFASALIDRAMARLRAESAGEQALIPFLLERGDHGELKRLAMAQGIPHNTLLQRLRRQRVRLRELLRDEFADLVCDPLQIDSELLELRRVLMT